jgi:hypothetical protein
MTDQAQSPHDDESTDDFDGLALHLASRHADPMALVRPLAENREQHRHEHTGPGTIRNHDEADLSWDRGKADAVLAEAGEEAPASGPDEEETARAEPEVQHCPATRKSALRRLDERLFLSPSAIGRPLSTPPGPLLAGSLPSGGKYRVYDRVLREMLTSLEMRSTLGVRVADPKATPADGLPLAQDDDEEPAARAHLDVHLSTAHGDDEAWYRTPQENEAAHRAILPHGHTAVQHRYERALAEKIEADLGHGTLAAWSPVPHPPHEVADLARTIGDIHEAAPGMSAALIALDLAWIKMAAWPWHRRLRAALLLAFPFPSPPSWRLGRR